MKAPLPILYSFRRCPYAMRARFTLAYSGLHCELREVDLKDKPQELLDISPKGTVPVLFLDDGTVTEESMDIIDYALKYNDPDGWLSPDEDSTKFIINKNDTEFVPALHKYKYYERYPDKTKEFYLKQAEEAFIIWLEGKLQINTYVISENISIADIAIFPFVRQFVMVDQEWFDNSPYAKIHEWLQRFINSSLYDVIMKKHSVWHTGDTITTLGSV